MACSNSSEASKGARGGKYESPLSSATRSVALPSLPSRRAARRHGTSWDGINELSNVPQTQLRLLTPPVTALIIYDECGDCTLRVVQCQGSIRSDILASGDHVHSPDRA